MADTAIEVLKLAEPSDEAIMRIVRFGSGACCTLACRARAEQLPASALFILLWELIITLGDEVEYVWR